MTSPKISVALVTKRPGGLDVAKYSLLQQTFKDFELLIVDELYRKRREVVERYFQGSGFDFIHVDASKENHPRWKPWDFTVIRSYNLALVYARGELLMKIDDFWVLNPTALEATWKAWEAWGRQGINTLLVPAAKHFLQIKPSFQQYVEGHPGCGDYLDVPPDTYVSIYTQDFNENPQIQVTAVDDRCPSVRVDGTMRDPNTSDPPDWRKLDAGAIGNFKYWTAAGHQAWALIAPVEDAVKVNGWDYSFCGKWGGEEEINQRMEYAFKQRYVRTTAAVAYQIPHDFEPGRLIESNLGFQGCNKERTYEKLRAGCFWVDNPFNIAEERQKVREGKKTVIFDF